MFRRRRKEKEGEKNFSVINGAAVLEQIISNFNGDCNPIRSYSLEELKNATNNFRLEMHKVNCYRYNLYQGTHQNREIAVKKFIEPVFISKVEIVDMAAKDIAITSRMSNHTNVLKLLGCCLETDIPILVYEFPENGNLCNRLFDQQGKDKLSWDQKLTIVIKIANSIAYLHHGLPNTFVHRDVRTTNIVLDRNLSPKLFDFQSAVRIPEGETHIDANVEGTYGYADPEALASGRYTEKTDVYSFGVLLCEVLTEKKSSVLKLENYNVVHLNSKEYDDKVTRVVQKHCKDYLEDERIRVQVMEYTKLMQRCLRWNSDDRPDMIEAEKELRRIKTL